MNASAVLTQLKAAGVHVAVANGKLELEGPTEALNEGVLNELRAIKAELIKLLSANEPAPAPQTTEGIIAVWRDAIRDVRSNNPDIMKLKAASLWFIDSPDAVAAVANGWDVLSLFGMHHGQVPKMRLDCWGIVLFMAWGVHGCTVETIDAKVCALRTRTGAVQRKPRLHGNFEDAIPWWEHSGVTNTGSVGDDPSAHNTAGASIARLSINSTAEVGRNHSMPNNDERQPL